MRWPGHLKPGVTSQQVMSMMDYFPTLTAAAGVTPGSTLPLEVSIDSVSPGAGEPIAPDRLVRLLNTPATQLVRVLKAKLDKG